VLRSSMCSEIEEKLEQARTLLHHRARHAGRRAGPESKPTGLVQEHYEWLKRKRVEVESEIRELERALNIYVKRKLFTLCKNGFEL